jgi:hypothetical protein
VANPPPEQKHGLGPSLGTMRSFIADETNYFSTDYPDTSLDSVAFVFKQSGGDQSQNVLV